MAVRIPPPVLFALFLALGLLLNLPRMERDRARARFVATHTEPIR